MNEARVALAVVARRQGTDAMPLATWGHVLSLELGWLQPGAARTYVTACRDAGLLVGDDDALRPSFSVADVDVPRRFRLAADSQPPEASGADPVSVWVDRIAAARDAERDKVLAEVAARQAAHGDLLSPEAAVLVLAAEAGLDVADAASEALARLKARA